MAPSPRLPSDGFVSRWHRAALESFCQEIILAPCSSGCPFAWSPQESVLQCLELALGLSSFCKPEPKSKSQSFGSFCYFFSPARISLLFWK